MGSAKGKKPGLEVLLNTAQGLVCVSPSNRDMERLERFLRNTERG